MKSNKILDVDFIGGEKELTNEEEKALSDFFSKKDSASKEIKLKGKTRKNKEKA